jgi:uncharacterized protein (TIGR02246 family)
MTATDSALEARVAELEALEEIQALFMDYGRALDTKDWDAYGRVFARDAEFSANIGTARGRDAIRALFEERLRDVDPGQHVFSNADIRVHGDRATARSMWAYVCPRPGDGWPMILQSGRYDDELVREDGRWVFGRRAVTRAIGRPPYTD